MFRIGLDRVRTVVEGHEVRTHVPGAAGQVGIVREIFRSHRDPVEERPVHLIPADVTAKVGDGVIRRALGIARVNVAAYRNPR